MSNAHPFPEATYHDNYSDNEKDDDSNSPKKGNGSDSEEEDDFVKGPQHRSTESHPLSSSDHEPTYSPSKSPQPAAAVVPPSSTSIGSSINLPLEPSIINAEPLDEFIREIAHWMAFHCRGKQNVEIEAKLGVLLIEDRPGNSSRLQLPVLTETILQPHYPGLRFESNMPLSHHSHFNSLLNSLVEQTGRPSYRHARIHYSHTKVIDSFYKSSHPSSKIRVTTDEKTGAVKECIIKSRVADLNIYSPKWKVDWRISVNTEIPVAKPMGEPLFFRRKDRITYTHQAFQVDLTQVTTNNPGLRNDPPQGQQIHELELEFRDTKDLMRHAALRDRRVRGGEQFDELVRVFVNNARILVKNCP
ncbi:CYTH-like domain-containing protein [Cantharellus anzutake]|uniref:CYTH-like domain-containing protein n=1 Tax=Cantharellus anzutake TaxID=1750568 RepID=UPI001906B335|nr:CYTH-like domain-containing protein [Cantharellus anzutake]KAF8334707.1 CYTH-like domain-containing protein [Cantharellus anzutake]